MMKIFPEIELILFQFPFPVDNHFSRPFWFTYLSVISYGIPTILPPNFFIVFRNFLNKNSSEKEKKIFFLKKG